MFTTTGGLCVSERHWATCCEGTLKPGTPRSCDDCAVMRKEPWKPLIGLQYLYAARFFETP